MTRESLKLRDGSVAYLRILDIGSAKVGTPRHSADYIS